MPKKTDPSYARWRLVENQRKWRIALEKNPIVVLELEDRVMPQTTSLLEAFWHKLDCDCPQCEGPYARQAKTIRMYTRPLPPAVKLVSSPLPELPRQSWLLLQAVSATAQSHGDQPAL